VSEDKNDIRRELEESTKEIKRLGGVSSLWKKDWLLELIQRTFKNHSERATAEYFKQKYPSQSSDVIARELTKVACQNAVCLGALTGIATSADEIVAIVAGGEGIVGLPANVLIFAGAASAEAYVLVKIQVQLVANLAKLYGTPLDPDDPEDIQTILHYAFGGVAAESLGRLDVKAVKNATQGAVSNYLSGETLQAIQKIARGLGLRILQRTIAKYAVPAASVLVGSPWNYWATKAVGKRAMSGFSERAKHKDELRMSESCGS
jgi:uncharacterized protein (DUF697 family)